MTSQTFKINAKAINKAVDAVYDSLLAKLGCSGSADAYMVSHWQEAPLGFRITIQRRSDGRTATRFVDAVGAQQQDHDFDAGRGDYYR
jgi:hypothetical protein